MSWTDVQALSVLSRGVGLGRSQILRFDLRPVLFHDHATGGHGLAAAQGSAESAPGWRA